MALKLTAALEKVENLEESDALFGNEGDPTFVRVRQATQRQHEERNNLFAQVKRQIDFTQQTVTEIQDLSWEQLKRKEVFLSLVECNLLDEDGELLFKSRTVKDRLYLAMTEHEFRQAWGKLPPFIAEEIYSKVLLVNPTWDRDGLGEVP